MSPKPVNYKYNQATISNHQYCRPNQSIMNVIEPQFSTIITVTQTSQLWMWSSHIFQQLLLSPKPVNYECNWATVSNNLSVSPKSVNYEYSPATLLNS